MAQKLLAYVKSQNMKHNIYCFTSHPILEKKKNDFRVREEIPIGEKTNNINILSVFYY